LGLAEKLFNGLKLPNDTSPSMTFTEKASNLRWTKPVNGGKFCEPAAWNMVHSQESETLTTECSPNAASVMELFQKTRH